jgi:hypothetical protein
MSEDLATKIAEEEQQLSEDLAVFEAQSDPQPDSAPVPVSDQDSIALTQSTLYPQS